MQKMISRVPARPVYKNYKKLWDAEQESGEEELVV